MSSNPKWIYNSARNTHVARVDVDGCTVCLSVAYAGAHGRWLWRAGCRRTTQHVTRSAVIRGECQRVAWGKSLAEDKAAAVAAAVIALEASETSGGGQQ